MGTITISRAEYDAKEAQIAELKSQNERLDGQLSLLFNEAEAYAAPPGVQKTTQVAAHIRKQSGSW